MRRRCWCGGTRPSIKNQVTEQIKQRKQDALDTVSKPGKADRVRRFLYAQLPYHPQVIWSGIRGGCSTCFSLYDLHQARIALDAAQREFVRRAGPWARQREPRQRKAADVTEEAPLHP
jgi:hypothetical protein